MWVLAKIKYISQLHVNLYNWTRASRVLDFKWKQQFSGGFLSLSGGLSRPPPTSVAITLIKRNPTLNPNLNPYPTLTQKPNHCPHSNSLSPEISSPEQMSPEQMSAHPCWWCFVLLIYQPCCADRGWLWCRGSRSRICCSSWTSWRWSVRGWSLAPTVRSHSPDEQQLKEDRTSGWTISPGQWLNEIQHLKNIS